MACKGGDTPYGSYFLFHVTGNTGDMCSSTTYILDELPTLDYGTFYMSDGSSSKQVQRSGGVLSKNVTQLTSCTVCPTPTPTATPTNTPTPTPTSTPVPPTGTPTPTPTPTPTSTPIPPTATPTNTPTPTPTATVPVMVSAYYGASASDACTLSIRGISVNITGNTTDFCTSTSFVGNAFAYQPTGTYYLTYGGNVRQISLTNGSNTVYATGGCSSCPAPTSTPTPTPTNTPTPTATPTPTPTPTATIPPPTPTNTPTPTPTATIPPPTPTPTSTPSPVSVGIYTGATFGNSSLACNNGASVNGTVFIAAGDTLSNGDTLYTDAGRTTTFNGNDNYYRLYSNATHYAATINGAGYVSNLIACNLVPTPTPTPTTSPTPTATPTNTPTPTATPDQTPSWSNNGTYQCSGCDKYYQQTDYNVNSPTYNTTRLGAVAEYNSTYCGGCCGQSTAAVWTNEGAAYCESCVSKQSQRDTNTCSATYNQTRVINAGSACNTSPTWVNYTTECVGYNLYHVQQDQNSCSSTYGDTRRGDLIETNSASCGYVAPTPTPTESTDSTDVSITNNFFGGIISSITIGGYSPSGVSFPISIGDGGFGTVPLTGSQEVIVQVSNVYPDGCLTVSTSYNGPQSIGVAGGGTFSQTMDITGGISISGNDGACN